MKKLLTVIIAISAFSSLSHAAKSTSEARCAAQLEKLALAAFDATDLRILDIPVSAKATNMEMKFKEVTIYQYKASFKVNFQLHRDNIRSCQVVGMSDIEEVLD